MRRLAPGLVLFLAIVLLGSMPVLAEEPVRVQASIDRNEITVGDPLLFNLVIEIGPGYKVTPPSLQGQVGDFEVLNTLPPIEQDLGQGKSVLHLRYYLTLFATGSYVLPSVRVNYTDPQGLRGVASSPEFSVIVRSVIANPAEARDIRDIKPQADVPGGPVPFVGESLALIGLTALAGLLFLLLREVLRWEARRRVPAVLLSPEEVAVAELDRINALRVLEQGRFKEHYTLLSDCLRRYIEQRYGLHALGRSSQELHREMVPHGVDRYQALMIDEILRESDAVKFGAFRPSVARAQNAVRVAREVIAAKLAEPEIVEQEV